MIEVGWCLRMVKGVNIWYKRGGPSFLAVFAHVCMKKGQFVESKAFRVPQDALDDWR